MEKRIKALLLKFPGTNCEHETARALESVGFITQIILWKKIQLSKNLNTLLSDTNLVVFPGGFSYGDESGAGILASRLIKHKFINNLKTFVDKGGLILGICNGFQILCHLGLLDGKLIQNKKNTFLCHWVKLINKNPKNIFLKKLPKYFELPIACAEGNYYSDNIDASLITLQYYPTRDHINQKSQKHNNDITNHIGSKKNIAGISDKTGKIFGLMPHPERFMLKEQHPYRDWQNPFLKDSKSKKNIDETIHGWGWYFFSSIFDHIKQS